MKWIRGILGTATVGSLTVFGGLICATSALAGGIVFVPMSLLFLTTIVTRGDSSQLGELPDDRDHTKLVSLAVLLGFLLFLTQLGVVIFCSGSCTEQNISIPSSVISIVMAVAILTIIDYENVMEVHQVRNLEIIAVLTGIFSVYPLVVLLYEIVILDWIQLSYVEVLLNTGGYITSSLLLFQFAWTERGQIQELERSYARYANGVVEQEAPSQLPATQHREEGLLLVAVNPQTKRWWVLGRWINGLFHMNQLPQPTSVQIPEVSTVQAYLDFSELPQKQMK